MASFDSKVVVVTGAGGGLGRAHALAFAREGAGVVVNDVGSARDGAGMDSSMADQVVAEIKASGGRAVPNYDSVATQEGAEAIIGTALKEFGRVDIMVNNAGILRDKTILKMTEDMWDRVIEVHLRGSFLCLQAAARAMVEQQDGGRIINTTSFAGLKGNFGQANYAAAKAGIYGLTLVGALELAKHRITVNVIAPLAKTRMTEDVGVVPDEMKPDMVSPMVLFLASEEAAGITGRVFGVHGNHLFEYKMTSTDGVKQDAGWSVEAIREALPRIESVEKPVAAPAAAPAAPATPQAPAPATPADRLADVFARMPLGFLPEKAGSWQAVLHFQIAGAGDFTLKIADGAASTAKGLEGSPTCVVKTDADTFLGMVDGRIDGQQAFMQGKVTATNISDMMKYRSSFSKEKALAAAKTQAAPAAAAPPSTPAAPSAPQAPAPETPADRLADVFARMPLGFLPEKAGSWQAVLHFQIAGAGDFTLKIADGAAASAKGLEGSPTCVVKTDADTFLGMVDGRIDGQQAFMQGKVTATNISDMMKYRSSFSKEKALAAAETQAAPAEAPPPASAPSAPDVDITPEERMRWVFQLAHELFPAEKLQDKDTSIDFDLGAMGRWRLVWSGEGAHAEKDPQDDSATSRIKADAAVLCDVIDGKADAGAAFKEMKIVATRMADFLAFTNMLRTQDHLKVIARALAECPVKVPSTLVDRTFHGTPLVVRYGHAESYAKATNDENPRYYRDRTDQTETPPLLAVRYHIDLVKKVLSDPAVEVDMMRLVHGEQEMIFHQPLRPRDVIAPKAAIYAVEHKDAGSLLTIRFRLMREGELANEAFARYFVRRADAGGKKRKKESPVLEIDKPDFEEPMEVRADQSRDYAEASLDNNPIHIDEGIAKAAGFKGVILHGLCTLAFASQAVVNQVAGQDPTRLASIKARFSKPVLMGERLVTRGKVIGSDNEMIQVAFEVVNQDNVPVVTMGLAKVKAQ